MTGPILAVDFGTTTSAAILVADGKQELIEEPSGHSRTWPSSVSLDGDRLVTGTPAEQRKRRHPQHYRAEIKPELAADREINLGGHLFPVTELIAAVMARMRAEAERVVGQPVHRAVLTIPASYRQHDRRRALMLEAAAQAGLDPAELLLEPVAAALAPAVGPPLATGSILLVYDYGGGTFDTALVRVTSGGNEVLGYAALDSGSGGRDIDRELSAQIEQNAGASLSVHTATERGRMVLGDAVTAIKHQLSDSYAVDDDYGTTDIVLSATRRQLEELTEPFLRRTIECVRAMLDARHVSIDDVTAVQMVGGVSRMPVVRDTVAKQLGRPIREAKSPELAVVQGAARFAAAVRTRVAVPSRQRTAERPLRWQFPGGRATLLGWEVDVGDRFSAGQPLAQLRLASGAIWELRAGDAPGLIAVLHAERGTPVFPGDWLVTAEAVPDGPPTDAELVNRLNCGATQVDQVVFSRDGTRLAAVSGLGAYLGSSADGFGLWEWSRGATHSRILASAFTPDGRSLAVGCEDGSVTILDAETFTPRRSVQCGDRVTGVAFSRDGAQLFTASDSVRAWDLESGEPRLLRAGLAAALTASTAGSLIGAAYPSEQCTRVMRVIGGVTITAECRSPAAFVTFSDDGAWFASGQDENSAGIWDAHTGQSVASLPHVAVSSAAFGIDGVTCWTAGRDGYARLWDVTIADELTKVNHEAPVASVALRRDGQLLATAGADGNVRIWRIQ